jgi:uncharacterized protein (TIGR02246 family)
METRQQYTLAHVAGEQFCMTTMRTHSTYSLFRLLLLAGMLACETRPRGQAGIAETQARREVSLAMSRYTDAARAVDANASAAFFTPTGTLFEPGISPIQGPDSIRAFIASFPGVKVDSATAVADTIEVFGETAIVWGTYFEKLHFPGQPESSQHGKFVMEWVMQPNGRRWLIERYYRIPLPGK